MATITHEDAFPSRTPRTSSSGRCTSSTRRNLSWNSWNRVQPLALPATFRFRGLRKDGSVSQAETDMIPPTFGGHTFAYHFVRAAGH